MREYTYKLLGTDAPSFQKNLKQLFAYSLTDDFPGFTVELVEQPFDGEPSALVLLDSLPAGYMNPEKFDDMLEISEKADTIEHFVMANDMRPEEFVSLDETIIYTSYVEYVMYSEAEKQSAREIAQQVQAEFNHYEPPRSVSKFGDKLEAKAERERQRKEAAEAAAARKAEKKKSKKGLFGGLFK